jgi:Ala-tRNA(Pro) deacylase
MDQGAKALICFANKQPILIVLPCSQKLDTKKFKSNFGIKDLRFATPDEVWNLTGLQIGAIPPLGKLFEIKTYVDQSLGTNEQIAFNAGDRCRSIIVKYADYIKISDCIIGHYGEEKDERNKTY